MKSLFDVQMDFLASELKSIDGAIRQHDEITKTTKNWAVVTWTASIGVALKEPALQPYIWITGVVPLVFWLVDASFRRIQRSFIVRIEQIADYINSQSFREAASTGGPISIPLLAMRVHTGKFKDSFLGTMCFRSVALLYVGLAVCSFAVWWIKHG